MKKIVKDGKTFYVSEEASEEVDPTSMTEPEQKQQGLPKTAGAVISPKRDDKPSEMTARFVFKEKGTDNKREYAVGLNSKKPFIYENKNVTAAKYQRSCKVKLWVDNEDLYRVIQFLSDYEVTKMLKFDEGIEITFRTSSEINILRVKTRKSLMKLLFKL